MKFDFTHDGKTNYRVSMHLRTISDSYAFSDFSRAKKLYDDLLRDHKADIVRIVLVDCNKRGAGAIIERFTNDDELRDQGGKCLATYSFVDNVIYIRSELIAPRFIGKMTKEQREEYHAAFSKSYEERLETYATPSDKALIKAFIEKHNGAKLSEFTIVG